MFLRLIIIIYIALYHALLKVLLHKTNDIPFNKGKEMLEFESEKLEFVLGRPFRVI